MRYLAIDLGDKRTGVATGDSESVIVSPIAVVQIPRGDRLLDALLDLIMDHCPDELVIGLPVNMDDTEGERARLTRQFGSRLQTRSGLPVHYHDERLTTFAANEQLARSGRTHGQKRELRDALAAANILRDFLEKP